MKQITINDDSLFSTYIFNVWFFANLNRLDIVLENNKVVFQDPKTSKVLDADKVLKEFCEYYEKKENELRTI